MEKIFCFKITKFREIEFNFPPKPQNSIFRILNFFPDYEARRESIASTTCKDWHVATQTPPAPPSFQLGGGNLQDAPGTYRYIVSTGDETSGCADTALITLEESAISTLVLDPVTWCDGEEVSIGLPPDTYDEVTWWNGDT